MFIATGVALLLAGWLGLLTFRRIVEPIRGLEKSVNVVAAGDYSKEIPFTHATDETGRFSGLVPSDGAIAQIIGKQSQDRR